MLDFFSSGNADPLAQSFVIPQEFTNGVFVTSVDIYFAEKGNETLPVFVQICEMENGIPTANVVKNASGIISGADVKVSSDSNTPTNCKFPTLVFLESGTEYCVKVLSNSIKYKVWIAQMGERRVDIPKIIESQPSTGSLFKSQNNSTWTPDQLQDLKFKLYYAKFNTASAGQVRLTNSSISLNSTLPPNPFLVTNSSPIVKVFHPNHGMTPGKLITYSNVKSGSTNYALINNIQFPVTAIIDSDSYIITMSAGAASSDILGGDSVTCSKSIKFDSYNLQSSDYSPKNTGVDYTVRLTTESGKENFYTKHEPGKFHQLDSPRYVLSNVNENVFLSGDKSLDVIISLYSSDPATSPVLNAESLGIALSSNKLDNRVTDPSGIGIAPVVDESVAKGNSLESRYISSPVVLKNVTTELKFMFAAQIPYPSTIELWYRTTMNSSDNLLSSVNWTQVPLSLESTSGRQFTDIEVDVVAPEVFTTYQAKVVFKSDNSSAAPKIKDFRIIALA